MESIRLLGALLILTAGGAAAIGSHRYERRRLAVLEGWIDLIRYAKGEIDCHLLPLRNILSHADPALLRACGGSGEERSLASLLEASQRDLEGEAKRLLTCLVREAGGCYREEQLRRLEYYLQALQRERDELSLRFPQKSKVKSAVCICISVGATILLW